jgi:hypothetical protein
MRKGKGESVNRAKLLMDQASMTAGTYLSEGVGCIDGMFGEGYAKEHPELVGAFMQAAAMDFAACMKADSDEALVGALHRVAENVQSDHPLMGETFEGLVRSLEEIASSIRPASLEKRQADGVNGVWK